MWDTAFAYELPTSEPRTVESVSSSLLPTPSALESTPTEEFVEETREAGISPDERLYLPGRKWHAQRTLSRIAPALLPTPGANDSTGAEKETREARQESGQTGGPSLRDLPKLLPTPNASDGPKGGPNRRDGKGEAYLSGISRLLPTPMANDENPGAGGELRAAIQHGPERRNETGTDSWGRPNRGRSKLLPTPQASDGDGGRHETKAMRAGGRRPSGAKATLTLQTAAELSGELSSQPFASGSDSSDDQHPDQLTIGDA